MSQVAQQSPPLESVPCPLCTSEENKPLFFAQDILHGFPGTFGVAKCVLCGCIFTNPRPLRSALHNYYPKHYAPYRQEGPKPTPSPSRMRRLLGSLFHRIMTSHDTVDIVREPGQRLLDLGCATGEYLHSQRKYGLELYGVEMGEFAAQTARERYGLNVFTGQLEEGKFQSEFFDGVVAWMVLEHLPAPRTTLAEIHRVLKPRGLFAFSVPNAGSWEFSFFRNRWFALQVPTHLTHFTISTLRTILAREHFAIESVRYQHNVDNIVASVGHAVETKFGSAVREWLVGFPDNASPAARFIVRPLLQPLGWILSLFRQAGRITVVARKLS